MIRTRSFTLLIWERTETRQKYFQISFVGTLLFASSTVQVSVEGSRVVARIDGGLTGMAARNETVVINASSSYDPDFQMSQLTLVRVHFNFTYKAHFSKPGWIVSLVYRRYCEWRAPMSERWIWNNKILWYANLKSCLICFSALFGLVTCCIRKKDLVFLSMTRWVRVEVATGLFGESILLRNHQPLVQVSTGAFLEAFCLIKVFCLFLQICSTRALQLSFLR